MGHTNSQFVLVEEQLAIFLYASVTGLTVQHLGERFQISNDTMSASLLCYPQQVDCTFR